MADLGASAEQLMAVAGDLRSVADVMQTGLSGLDDHVLGLLGSGWVGEAGSAFSGVWGPWHEGASNVVRGLSAMADLLNTAAQHYTGTDAASAAAIDGAGL